jgi:hypothetical protein
VAGTLLASPIAGRASSVAYLVFNPTPIGESVKTPTAHQISVVLTAEDSSKAPIPNTTVYLMFRQAHGGGSAFANGTVLTLKAHAFQTNSSGQVDVTYVTPTTYPSSGSDLLRAQNGATTASTTLGQDDAFCFSSISSLGFTPTPLGAAGSLGPHTTIPVTLTALGSNGAPDPGATVFLRFHPASSGGSAYVGSTPLNSTAQTFTTDSNGQVHVTYTTSSTHLTSGSDVLLAGNGSVYSCASARDAYAY